MILATRTTFNGHYNTRYLSEELKSGTRGGKDNDTTSLDLDMRFSGVIIVHITPLASGPCLKFPYAAQ